MLREWQTPTSRSWLANFVCTWPCRSPARYCCGQIASSCSLGSIPFAHATASAWNPDSSSLLRASERTSRLGSGHAVRSLAPAAPAAGTDGWRVLICRAKRTAPPERMLLSYLCIEVHVPASVRKIPSCICQCCYLAAVVTRRLCILHVRDGYGMGTGWRCDMCTHMGAVQDGAGFSVEHAGVMRARGTGVQVELPQPAEGRAGAAGVRE